MVDKIKGSKGKGGGSGGGFKEDPNTLTTDTQIRVVYLFSEGPVEGLATGDGKSLFFNDVPLVDSNGDYTHQNVAYTFRPGLPDQEHIPGFEGASTVNSVATQVTFSTPVTMSIAGNYDAAVVTVSVPQLTFTDSTNGKLTGTNLSYAIDVKTATGSYVTVHNVNLTNQKTTSEWRQGYRVDLPEGGSPWTIRVRRLTADSSSLELSNDLYVATYATVTEGKYSYRNSCVLGLHIPAKEFDSQVPTFKALIKGVKVWVPTNYDPTTRLYATTGPGTSGGIWDGSFKSAWTDNPAWIFHDLLINDRYGLGQDFNPDNEPDSTLVDKWALYTIAQFCDGMVDDGYGGTEPRYTVNIQITDRQQAYDLLQEIISTMNGMMYFSSEQIVPVVDKPDELDNIFTQADVVDGLFEYSGTALKTRHSAILSYYNDPNNLYKRSVVIHEDNDLINQIGYRMVEINNFGCTSRAQALRSAKWILETEKNQTQTVTFKTGHRGGFVTPGSVIKIFDDYKAGERLGGRILSYTGTSPNITFTLDKAVNVTSGSTFIYINDNGEAVSKTISVTATTNTITLTNANGVPVNGGAYAIVRPDLDGQLYRVIMVKEEDQEQYSVIALQHNESKFAIIDAAPIFDDLPTSVIGAGKLPTVTDIDIVQWWETVSGTEPFPHITVSWVRPNDVRVIGVEVQLKTPTKDYYTVYTGNQSSWDSDRLSSTNLLDYSVRIRCFDNIGRYSSWAYNLDFGIPGKDDGISPPINLSATGIIGGYSLNWDNPTDADFKWIEIKEASTNVFASAVTIATTNSDFYIKQGLNAGVIKYLWIRSVSHALTNNTSTWVGPVSVTAKGVNIADFDDEVTGIPIVDVLPNPVGYTGPPIVFLTTDQRLYVYNGSAWTDLILDVPEDYQPGIPGFSTPPDTSGYEEGAMYYNTTDGKLYILQGGVWVAITADADDDGIGSGSTLPSSGMIQGDLFFLTTDNKLYRYTGSAWTAAVAAVDITGTLAANQIANGAIDLTKFANGLTPVEVVATNPSTGNFEGRVVYNTTDNKIYRYTGSAWTSSFAAGDMTGQLTDSQIADIAAAKLTGQITETQIADNAITAVKILAGSVTSNHIAANTITAADIASGTITATQIAATTITAGQIAAGTITGNKIAANTIAAANIVGNTITAAEIAANAITASEIAANAVIADKIQAGAITTAKIAAGAVTANELAANSVVAGKIAANTIAAANIQSGAITTAKLQANAVTANELASNAVTAGKIAAGAVTANAIGAGTVTVAINLGSSGKIILDGVNNRIIISD